MNFKTHNSVGSLTRRIFMSAAFVALTLGASAAVTTVTSFTHRDDVTMEANPNGYQQQAVHQDPTILYRNAGDVLLTYRNQAFTTYTRWFDYTTGKKMANLTTSATDYAEGDNFGLFVKSNATYNYPGTGVYYIGCDQSKYTNGSGFGTATIVEPTLSQRIVYQIRPAKEMADSIDAHKSTSNKGYYENYNIMAPTGNNVYIGPKYAYTTAYKTDGSENKEIYPNYYCNASAPVQMLESGTTVIYTINGTDYTSEPSATLFTKNKSYTVTRTTTTSGGHWVWKKGSTELTESPISGQYVKISSTSAASVYYYLEYVSGSSTVVETATWKTSNNDRNNRYWSSKGSWTQTSSTSADATTYYVAKFTVNFVNRSEVGPLPDFADPNYLTGTDILAEQDFNFNEPGNTNAWYNTPFSVDESTYGFRNHDLLDGATGYNEYAFNNYGYGHTWSWGATTNNAGTYSNHYYTAADPSGYDKTKGYALYCDGSQKAGKVFSINFTANLCPGAIMYFSAWVGDHNKTNDTHPILELVVVGVTSAGVEEDLVTFSSGEMTDILKWNRILFPLEFKEEKNYHHYTLRIINKAANVSGNDFWLDDIRVYLKPAPLQPIEASSANECLTDDSPLTLYTRIDYAQSNEATSGTSPLYYRWLDYQGNIIETDKYYGVTADKKCGYIAVDQRYRSTDGMPSSQTVASFAAFDNAYRTTPTPVAKYVFETGLTPLTNGNTDRYVLYIATPITVKLGDKYTCKIAKSASELNNKNSCSNSADITVSNGMRINSVAGGGMVKGLRKQICANYSYDLTVVMEYAVLEGNTTHTDRSPYVAHWLFGLASDVEADFTANGVNGLYGANFTTIQKAVEAYKTDTITAAQTALLNRLVQKGLLQLCKYNTDGTPVATDTTYFVMPLNGETQLSYTAFPVAKVKSTAPDCFTPQSITLFFPTGENIPDRNVITFVKRYNETVPTFVNSRPRRVRIIEGTSSAVVKTELSNTNRAYAFKTVSLHSTDDATYTGATVPTITPGADPFTGDNLYVTFGGLGDLKAGHSYTFKVLYNLANPTADDIASACTDDKNAALRDGEAYITFLIVPKLLTYTGNGISAAWNDDYNWSLVNGTDTTVTFVPLKETSVIFQSGDHIIADSIAVNTSVEAKKRLQEAAVETAALPYITYDINYQPYTCNNVYVPAATALPGQTNIDVKGTWTFEMPVTPNKWVMSAMPVQGIVSGDIFIPASGEESQEDYFAVKEMSQTSGNYAADRITYSFYNSMFNQSVINKDVNTTYDITSSTWSFATNALTTAFTAGFGWSLGFDNAAEGKSIRLPKKDTEYHYFRNDTWLGMSETITRDANYGKAAFNGDVELTLTQNADGKVFLLGNPTFAYIDLMALKNANSNITGVFYLSGLDNGSRYDHVTGQALADDWYTTDGQAPRYLAPMHAVLVVKNGDAAKELKIKITKEMLVTSNGSKDGAIITGAPRRAAALSAEKAIYIKAETGSFSSTALLLEDADASNAFFQDEDAEVFLLDQAKTPFAVYTVADSKALAINRISDLDVVPLGFYAQKNVSSEKIVFTGADAYLSEWDLVDNSTGNREALSDGFTTTLSMSNNGVIRYYLEHARKTAPAGSDVTGGELTFSTFTQDGMLTVFAADDMIDFRLYDAAGRLLAADKNAGRQQDFCLPKGVYVVRANGKAAKVIVK